MARLMFVALVLVALVAGKGAKKGVKRTEFQSPRYPLCFFGNIDEPDIRVNEATGAHSCVVRNNGMSGELVRVMCGGGNSPDKDSDRATYVYLEPSSTTLVLEGKCPVGHRCRICGRTSKTATTGDDKDGQTFLELQNYECSRRCVAVLYQHEDFNGHIQTFTHNAPDLSKTLMEGKISAVKVIGSNCQMRLWKGLNFKDPDTLNNQPTCTLDTGDFKEVTWDMDDILEQCKCHDCISSMSIREQDQCGAGKTTSGNDCEKCKEGQKSTPGGCCIVRKAHGHGVARADALKRLFSAMATVLEE